REVDPRRARRRLHIARAADLHETIPTDYDCGVLDGSPPVADDGARAFEDSHRRRLREDCCGCRCDHPQDEKFHPIHGFLLITSVRPSPIAVTVCSGADETTLDTPWRLIVSHTMEPRKDPPNTNEPRRVSRV